MPTFEQHIGERLRTEFPSAALSNLPVFRPDLDENRHIGFEIDHLVHVRTGDVDRLFIIECKGQTVRGGNGQLPRPEGPWTVMYANGPSDARRQVLNHAMAVLHFLANGDQTDRPLTIEACVVSSDPGTHYVTSRLSAHLGVHLCSEEYIFRELRACRLLRVQQSALLSELRTALRDPDVGHPSIPDAIRFVKRTRSVLDSNLYRTFKPAERLWAINGTAGMGKTVHLAYSLFVFASDHRVVPPSVEDPMLSKSLESFESGGKRLGLPPHLDRVIYAVALKEKQKEVLRAFYEHFMKEFGSMGDNSTFRVVPPVFRRWDGVIPPDCNILVIDEAHDLDEPSQAEIARWQSNSDEDHPRYLAIACDRHQKLRLIGTRAPLINGLNFSNQTTKLKRNYRNPFPVFAASLALMFRWFARSGPMVLPSRDEIESAFGLRIGDYSLTPRAPINLHLRNDSHPANHWLYSVSQMESAADAHKQLAALRLPQKDILWVRFGPESPLFDYELLSGFTYHNCHTVEAVEIVDKYIKGQEFPVVVIEGLPSDLVEWEASPCVHPDIDEAEGAMWKARRLLYLCSSRSTAFLYFVMGEHLELPSILVEEMKSLAASLERPSNPFDLAGYDWRISFTTGSPRRTPDVFDEDTAPASIIEDSLPAVTFTDSSKVTATALAGKLGLSDAVMIETLLSEGKNLSSYSVVPVDIAQEIALQRGVRLEVGGQALPSPRSDGQVEAIIPTEGRRILLPANPTRKDLAKALGVPVSELFPSATNVLEPLGMEEATAIVKRYGTSIELSEGGALASTLSPVIDAPNGGPEALLGLVRESRWKQTTAAAKYMELLERLLKHDAAARSALLNFPVAQHRIHFATSASVIEASGTSTKPRKIGSTGIWAITNLSTERILNITDSVLRTLKYSIALRTEVRGWLGSRK